MKLFYRKIGEGKPLIVLHGLFGMSDNWNTLAKEFAEHGYAVYLPDARNHGRSPQDDEFNYDVMADDILQLMEDEAIDRAILTGHSMGGKTAMFFASKYAERVEKLVVADMAPRAYAATNEHVIAALRQIDLQTASSRKEVETALSNALKNDEVTTQFLLKSLYWNDDKKLDWRFNLDAIENNLDKMSEALPSNFHFNGDTLFIRGEKSNYITEADEPLIKKHFPKAIIKTIANAGHWIHAENPKGFMEAVALF
jgi:esterase